MYFKQSLLRRAIVRRRRQAVMVAVTAIIMDYYENYEAPRRYTGSIVGHKVVNRDRKQGQERLEKDYFVEDPVYDSKTFRRRFRMNRDLFVKIVDAVEQHDSWFKYRQDCTRTWSFTPLQKFTAAIRMLAYGSPADQVDEYLRMSKETTRVSLVRFCSAVIELYKEEYLRKPNVDEMKQLLQTGQDRGFPGMIGSIDCMNWAWKNCPVRYQGQYVGKEGHPTVVLEAVASQDLYIWHAFFGCPGAINDISVLERSYVFQEFTEGRSPEVKFTVNGHEYNMGYYLADGIYPSYANLVKTISNPNTDAKRVRSLYSLENHILIV